MAADEGKLILFGEGWINKKVPGGLCICTGMRPWQRRYFILTNKALKYYPEQVKVDDPREPRGVIPLMNISKVEYLPEKKIGCRFDITVKTRRVYALDASTVSEAKEWVQKIKQAVLHNQREIQDKKRDENKPQKAEDILSPLQEMFLKAKFGDMAIKIRNEPKNREEEKLSQLMRQEFKTDSHVLRFLLVDIVDGKNALFDYDVTTDAEEEENDAKLAEQKRKDDAAAAAAAGIDPKDVKVAIKDGKGGKPATAAAAAAPNPEDSDAPPPPPDPEVTKTLDPSGGVVVTISAPKKVSAFSKRSYPESATSSVPIDEGTRRVVDMLRVSHKDFIRNVLPIFSSKDTLAHGLAVKVMWILFRGIVGNREDAAQQFCDFTRFYCAGARFNTTVRQAMFTLLVTDRATKDVEKPTTIGFFMNVTHFEVWRAIFACANESDMEERRKGLEDVTALLHENYKNAKSIARTKDWQSWVYLLLTDLPRNEQSKTHKQVYGFVLNAITLIHYAFFHECDPAKERTSFAEVITDSLQSLHLFAGLNNGSAALAQTILSALLNKLFHGKGTMTADTNYDSVRWGNFLQLNRALKRYIFQTAYWRSTTAAEDEKESQAHKEEESKRLEEERRRQMENADHGMMLGADGNLMPLASAKTTAEERQKMVELMEKKRREAEEFFVLAKCRVLKSNKNLAADDTALMITDYGLHWNDKGEPSDLLLVELIKKLYKALRLDEFDPAIANPSITSTEKAFLFKCKAESDFWKDTATFMGVVRRHQIDDLHLYTYRKLSFVMQDWLKAGTPAARETIIADMKYTVANKGATRDGPSKMERAPTQSNIKSANSKDEFKKEGASTTKPKKKDRNDFE